MLFKKCDWLDINTMTQIYGIQVKYNNQWLNVAKDGKPLFYNTEKERNTKIKDLKSNITI